MTKKILLLAPGTFALIFFLVYGCGDYWAIGVVADPHTIAEYRFGAEAMIAHGGEKYRSASVYAAVSLAIGLLAASGLFASWLLLFNSRAKALLKAYFATGLTFVVIVLVENLW